MNHRTCRNCGTPTGDQYWCSTECINAGAEHTPEELRCPKCETVKPVDEFHLSKHRKPGRTAQCAECAKAYQAKRRKAARALPRPKQATEKNCEQCGVNFIKEANHQRYCSESCLEERRKEREHAPKSGARECRACGATFIPKRKDGVNCSPECVAKGRRIKNANKNNKRRLWAQFTTLEPIDPMDIHERDGWTCGICGKPIGQSIKWPNVESPSIDHVRPLSWGGAHVAGNLQSAHLGCNQSKGAHGEMDDEAIAFRERASQYLAQVSPLEGALGRVGGGSRDFHKGKLT